MTQQDELLALEPLVRLPTPTAGTWILMSVPGVDQVGERPLEEMVQKASQQAVVLAREQVDLARRELAARARQAGPGAAMVSGGVLLGALASGTGTAALILLLARRPGASAAALGVTGAYVSAGALLAREGLVRLREAGPHLPDAPVEDDPVVQDSAQAFGSAKRRTAAMLARQTAAKSTRRTKHAAESARETTSAAGSARRTKSAKDPLLRSTNRPKPKSKTPSSRRRASSTD